VLSVAEAARAVLAKLPRLHVERVAIDDAPCSDPRLGKSVSQAGVLPVGQRWDR
jgi:hypothetical protein